MFRQFDELLDNVPCFGRVRPGKRLAPMLQDSYKQNAQVLSNTTVQVRTISLILQDFAGQYYTAVLLGKNLDSQGLILSQIEVLQSSDIIAIPLWLPFAFSLLGQWF